jgi:SAM-dependent methyltransferase
VADEQPAWEWDETLFAGAAPYYEQGRVPYAVDLPDAFARVLQLDGRGRLLDVGCGPGSIALRLAPWFAHVVGLDADADMLAEAARLAAARDIDNATWVHRRAEELPAGLGTFRVVTFAQSFHWMDRGLVAARVHDMLEPDGVVVHVDVHRRELPPPASDLPEIPYDRIDELRMQYLGADRRAGQSVRTSSPSNEAAVFHAAGFTGPELVIVPDGRTFVRTIDDIVAETFSMSSTAPHLFGARVEEFDADLRALLSSVSPTGTFSIRARDSTLMIWRPV